MSQIVRKIKKKQRENGKFEVLKYGILSIYVLQCPNKSSQQHPIFRNAGELNTKFLPAPYAQTKLTAIFPCIQLFFAMNMPRIMALHGV